MKNQKKHLIILIVALLVFVAGYFGLKKYNEIKAKEEMLEDYDIVLNIDRTTVTAYSLTNENGTVSMFKEGDVWKFTDDKNAVNKETLDSTLITLCELKSYETIENVTDFSQYGLSSPTRSATITLSDGTTHKITIGDVNNINNKYYFRIDDSTTVYMSGSDLYNYLGFDKTKYQQ